MLRRRLPRPHELQGRRGEGGEEPRRRSRQEGYVRRLRLRRRRLLSIVLMMMTMTMSAHPRGELVVRREVQDRVRDRHDEGRTQSRVQSRGALVLEYRNQRGYRPHVVVAVVPPRHRHRHPHPRLHLRRNVWHSSAERRRHGHGHGQDAFH